MVHAFQFQCLSFIVSTENQKTSMNSLLKTLTGSCYCIWLVNVHEKKSNLVESCLKLPNKKTKRDQLIAKNDIFNNTPLHVAFFLGNEKIVETIMKNCDEKLTEELLKQKNKLGDTPVHVAAAKNHHRFV